MVFDEEMWLKVGVNQAAGVFGCTQIELVGVTGEFEVVVENGCAGIQFGSGVGQ